MHMLPHQLMPCGPISPLSRRGSVVQSEEVKIVTKRKVKFVYKNDQRPISLNNFAQNSGCWCVWPGHGPDQVLASGRRRYDDDEANLVSHHLAD